MIFTVRLRPLPGVDPIMGLRATLKIALRQHGLKALSVREEKASSRRSAQAVGSEQACRKRRRKMKMSDYAGAAFIGPGDVEGGPFRSTIASIELGQYGRPVVTFANGRKLTLNKTNVATLINAFGDNSEDYVGERLELYAGKTTFKGVEQATVLVRPLPSAADNGDDMSDKIPF